MTETTTTPDETLWCVHIPSPDDLYAAATKEDAQQHADALNAAIRRTWERDPRPDNDPTVKSMTAAVITWPGSAESHKSDLLRYLAKAPTHAR